MRRGRDRISLAVGGAALAISVLAVGGVFRWTQAAVALLVAGALAAQISSRRKLDRFSPIMLLIGLATAFTALQLIPLPNAIIDALNPMENGLRTDGAALAGTHPWSCLSMDPPGTVRALVFFLIVLGVAALSLRLASSERGRFALIGGVAIVCGLTAAVTGVHQLVNADALYGVYAPMHAAPPILGPLLNPNHLGCLMAFGSTIAVGLTFYDKQSASWRALWVVIAVGCMVAALASQSRGAAIALTLGIAVTSGCLIGRGLGHLSTRRARTYRQLPVAIVMAIGFGLAVYVSAGDVAQQLDRTTMSEVDHPTSKFAAWKASVHLVAETPWVGVGRGAVEPAFTRVFDGSAFVTFSHLENEYVSAVVEWGVPAALALGLALAWCIIIAVRRWREGPLAAAALGGLIAVMFQSSVDFGIEMLGLAVPVTIVACTVLYVPLRETSRFTRLRIQRSCLVAGLCIAAFLVTRPFSRSLQEDHDMMADANGQAKIGPLLDMAERHPLDYFAFGQAAEQMMATDDPRAVPFLNHAMRLHPAHPGLHRLAGRLLTSVDHKVQATVEYSLAMRGTAFPHLLVTEMVTELVTPEAIAAAIPVDYVSVDLLLHSLTELKRDDVSEQWLIRVLDSGTHDLRMIDRLYDLATNRGDFDVALRAATVRQHEARTTTSRLMVARANFARKDYAAVQKDLSDVQHWSGRIDEQADGWLLVCDTYKEQAIWDRALECIHQLDGSGLLPGGRHDEIASRERDIEDHRNAESKLKQIQDLERSMNLPIDTYLPIVHGSSSAPAPTSGIINPITNPLLRSTPEGDNR